MYINTVLQMNSLQCHSMHHINYVNNVTSHHQNDYGQKKTWVQYLFSI